jgi:hypothetical protein
MTGHGLQGVADLKRGIEILDHTGPGHQEKTGPGSIDHFEKKVGHDHP